MWGARAWLAACAACAAWAAWGAGGALLCYSCSGTHRAGAACGGDFAPSALPFNSTRRALVNCTAESALCFVRSWRLRARAAWLVQRGCYSPAPGDVLPRSVTRPRRAMACRTDRLAEGEYKLCFCGADWCNGAPPPPLAFVTALAPALALALPSPRTHTYVAQ